jgi:hypothetical protein
MYIHNVYTYASQSATIEQSGCTVPADWGGGTYSVIVIRLLLRTGLHAYISDSDLVFTHAHVVDKTHVHAMLSEMPLAVRQCLTR